MQSELLLILRNIQTSKQEIGPQESRQKEVYAQQLSQSQPLNPLSPVAVPLCSIIADKQSSIEPSKNKVYQYTDLSYLGSYCCIEPSKPYNISD